MQGRRSIRQRFLRRITATAFLICFFMTGFVTTKAKQPDLQEFIEEPERQEWDMNRFLKADGNVLRNASGTGEIVTLRGTNVGGWQVMEGWMCPTDAVDQKTAIAVLTERFGKEKAEELFKIYESSWWQETDFDNAAELNFNVLRLPISHFNLLDEEGNVRKDTLALYDWFVEECAKREIYVIIDLHAAPGSQSGRDHSGDTEGSVLFTDETAMQRCIFLWEQLAEHFKGNPTIAGYDLLNEPEGNMEERAGWGKVQLPFYHKLYQAIRGIDPDHLIILEAIWNATDMPHPSEYGWENVMYQYHFYGWDEINDAQKSRNFTNSKVSMDKKMNFNVPVLIGEFTLFDNLQAWEHALSVYEERGWSWTTWTYKTVGMGSWGIFNSDPKDTPKVMIHTDTYDTIKKKWSGNDTKSYYKRNIYLHDLLRVMANPEKSSQENQRKWLRSSLPIGNTEKNPEAETAKNTLRTGYDATAEYVDASEVTAAKKGETIIKLTVNGVVTKTGTTFRNVCITPERRKAIDTTEMDYLLIEAFVRQGKDPLFVTLVDRTGAVWSKGTSDKAYPIAHQWEKVFVDLTECTIDRTAITEIRIGGEKSGTYYFGNIYFGESYADKVPIETLEQMDSDQGSEGILTDWEEVEKNKQNIMESKNVKNENSPQGIAGKVLLVLGGVCVISLGILTVFRKCSKRKR